MFLLWRHHGYRKLSCVLAARLVCHIVRWFCTFSPPGDWSSWPTSARMAVKNISTGTYDIVFCLWLFLVLQPLWKYPNLWVRSGARGLLAVAALVYGLPGIRWISLGMGSWLNGSVGWSPQIGWLLFWIVGLPVSAATLVAFLPDLIAQIQANPTYRRLFVSGRGHAAGWLGPVGIRRFTKPLPLIVPTPGGHRSPHLHLGRSLFESTFAGGQDVWLKENSHFVTYARAGSGKFVTSIANNLAMYQGSGIFTSLKPELADFAVGRRTDPTLFEDDNHPFKHLGTDTRELSRTTCNLPGGRSFVLDPTHQSVWAGSCHNFLSEVDIRDPGAVGLITAIAEASFPDNPQQRDPFWIMAPRGLFAASIGHILTTERNPRLRNLANCARFCMGIDPKTGNADPDVFKMNLITLMQNGRLGGFIQRSAAAIGQVGPEAMGGIFAELERHTRWLADTRIQQQVERESDFSYQELGDDEYPVSVFPILPRGGPDLVQLIPWLRTHIELSMAIFENKRERPQTEILTLFDEFRQYGQRINAIRRGATTLREAGVKLWVVVQSRPSLVETLGKDGADELESCSALEFFGTDQETAEKIARALGRYTLKNGRGWQRSATNSQIIDVVTPAEVMHELRKGSDIKYVFPATLPPMRLRRAAYKPLTTEEGVRYGGLPLTGHYDEHLSQYRYARRRA